MALESRGRDETTDKNGRAVVIVIGTFNDLAVYRYAGLVRKVAFSTGGSDGGCRKPIGVTIHQTSDQVGGVCRIVEILDVYLVDHFVGRIVGALIDAVCGDRWVRAGAPKKEKIGGIDVCNQHHAGEGGNEGKPGLTIFQCVFHLKSTCSYHNFMPRSFSITDRVWGPDCFVDFEISHH